MFGVGWVCVLSPYTKLENGGGKRWDLEEGRGETKREIIAGGRDGEK